MRLLSERSISGCPATRPVYTPTLVVVTAEHAHDEERDDLESASDERFPKPRDDDAQLISSESDLPEDEVERTRQLMRELLKVPRSEVRKRD